MEHFWWKCGTVQATLDNNLAVSYKLNVCFPCYPAISLLDIYLREMKTNVHAKTWTRKLMAALFVRIQSWKTPNVPRQVNI